MEKTQTIDGWEKEFNEKFSPTKLGYLSCTEHHAPASPAEIKSFISQLLAKAQEEGFELGVDEKFQADQEQKGYERGFKSGIQEGLKLALGALPKKPKNCDCKEDRCPLYDDFYIFIKQSHTNIEALLDKQKEV